MDTSFQILIAAGLLGLGIIGFVLTRTSQFLSIREHVTYTSFLIRELDTIRDRIAFLEQTRPTTGELEAKLGGGNKSCPPDMKK